MNRRVYWIAAALTLAAIVIMAVKVTYGGQFVSAEQSRHLWKIDIIMNLIGQGARAKVRLTLPKDTSRQTIYNENFYNDELVFYVRDRGVTGNRIGFWRAEILDGSKTIHYSFSAQLKSLTYSLPQTPLPSNPYAYHPQEMHTWLDASKFIQSGDSSIKRRLKKVIGREKKTSIVMRKLFDYVSGQVKYKSEKGSKSAKEALDKLVADCGGQARLFAALSRAAGIPSRIVGGLILTSGIKNTTHVWVENYIGNKWIPFDVVNNHYASIPNHYLELYRGDYSLIKHLGLAKFEYFFAISEERLPPVDNPWSLYILPIHFQSIVRILLLIPIGALIVAFFRTVIGVPTFGTFSPILLALAFRDISLFFGIFCLLIIFFIGWGLRKGLDNLKILVIPRLSIIVTTVVICVLIMIVVGYHLGWQQILFMTLFPMIIITWTIERFSVLQIEDGTDTAVGAAAGTIGVAIVAYWIMESHLLRLYLFAFPELLLIVMALLLILGRYTGLRVTELWRFRDLMKYIAKK